MKRILYIAPHSFPIKSSESICNSKVAYTLAKGGYCVDVYTCVETSTYPDDKYIDDFLRNSSNLNIYYVKGRMITKSLSFFNLILTIFHYLILYLKTGYYYNGLDYSYQIIKKVKDIIAKKGKTYDVMITRGYHTDYAGLYIHKKYGIPWIANWNDPYPTRRFPAPYGFGYDAPLSHSFQKLYDTIQTNINVHTFPCVRLRNYMLKCFTHINESNTCVIHHMALSDINVPVLPKADSFCLVHTGWVKSPRNPRPFLEALSNVVKKTSQRIQCIFVGGYDSNNEKIVINAYKQDHQCYLVVEDYGDGFLGEDPQKLFGMFYTQHQSYSDSFKGVGLGLTICKAIIEAHQGTIEAKECLNHQGAQFIITLPMEDEYESNNISC